MLGPWDSREVLILLSHVPRAILATLEQNQARIVGPLRNGRRLYSGDLGRNHVSHGLEQFQ
jgi:hypothetical protein